MFVITIDFARVYWFFLTVSSCARNGAMHASDPAATIASPYASPEEAALADATSMHPALTVDDVTMTPPGTDAYGDWVECTVQYTFNPMIAYPGLPSSFTLSRTVRMRRVPDAPDP
jgi:hypothetical protein